jgi:BirA family transcriptional regulator, biotin operon repressor / biotin---[acetyl-CoA-carboxylase] ligase
MKQHPQNQLLYLKRVDSTNRELWRMLDSDNNLPEGLCIWAGLQTAGRGQGNNTWHSSANNNLSLSILLKPHFLPPRKQFMLNKSIALAIRATLEELTDGLVFAIKWPNDIYCQNKKIAGTLMENRIQGNLFETSIAGIGININQTGFPGSIPNPVSLKMLTGVSYDLELCLDSLLKKTHHYYNLLRDDQEVTINEEYLNNLLGYQEYRLFSQNNNEFRAMIAGVNEYGKIILKDENEMPREYGVGEIVFVLNDQA